MKLLLAFLISCITMVSQARDLVLITPNTPGSTSDIAAKAIAEAYHNRTGHKILVENIGGGHQIPAVNAWKSRPSATVLMTTTGILVFNPKLRDDLPYDDKDFDHVTMIAAAPSVWVVRNESPYRTMHDLVKDLPKSAKSFVAYANYPEVVNLNLLRKKYGWATNEITAVKYRGVPEAVIGIIEGSIEVGILTINSGVVEQIRAGRLRALATTHNQDLDIAGSKIPPASRVLDVEQFNGGIFLSLRTGLPSATAEQIKSDLIGAVGDPLVAERLRSQNQTVINRGPDHMKDFIKDFRDRISTMRFEQ